MMFLLSAVVLAIPNIIILVRLYQKSTNAICTSKKSLVGRTAIVTGGTAGMGLEIAKDFARRGAKVIIACPYEQEGLQAKKTIVEETGNESIIFKLLDLGSLKSVRKFAEDILTTEDRLDLLMNNAGILPSEDFNTQDGLNFVMQVNYYGHFLLTILLLPLLKKSGQPSDPSRIVNTSSVLRWIGRIDIENMNKSGYYWHPFFQYSNSKLCVLPFSRELTERLGDADVVVNSVDPGAVGTGIYYRNGKFFGALASNFCYYLYKTPWEGAQTALHVALDEEAGKVSGDLFKNSKRSREQPFANRNKSSTKLWEESVRLVKLNEMELERSFS